VGANTFGDCSIVPLLQQRAHSCSIRAVDLKCVTTGSSLHSHRPDLSRGGAAADSHGGEGLGTGLCLIPAAKAFARALCQFRRVDKGGSRRDLFSTQSPPVINARHLPANISVGVDLKERESRAKPQGAPPFRRRPRTSTSPGHLHSFFPTCFLAARQTAQRRHHVTCQTLPNPHLEVGV
jgi:hypothetical protein